MITPGLYDGQPTFTYESVVYFISPLLYYIGVEGDNLLRLCVNKAVTIRYVINVLLMCKS